MRKPAAPLPPARVRCHPRRRARERWSHLCPCRPDAGRARATYHRSPDPLGNCGAGAAVLARRAQNADGTRGDWRVVTYGEALAAVRSIGRALLDAGASVDRPLAILSENSIEHALLGLGRDVRRRAVLPGVDAIFAGQPDFENCATCLAPLPGRRLRCRSRALQSRYHVAVAADIPVVCDDPAAGSRTAGKVVALADWLATQPTAAVDAAHAATGPDTVAKFLFTSGSTKAAERQ